MKRIATLTILGLTALGTWAFYPEATAPTGYLTVMGSGRPGTSSDAPEVTTIWPDGRKEVQPLPAIKLGGDRITTSSAVELHRAELLIINRLYAQGWRVVSTAQSTVGVGATTETVYLLERR